ncbi:MAG: hypothetical protein M3170_07310 [Candidatus Dormibacteraeota bacterium]|nr:hypothetical protein [Candidatus Dormibacteraeota bacterium]
MAWAMAERERWLADPLFAEVPVGRLTAKEQTLSQGRLIRVDHATLGQHDQSVRAWLDTQDAQDAQEGRPDSRDEGDAGQASS